MNKQITRHLSTTETACHCGCGFGSHLYDFKQETALAFEQGRRIIGERLFGGNDTPLHINCGNRCKAHNKAIGGASDSRHTYGDALDIDCPEGADFEIFYSIWEVVIGDFGGVGKYPQKRFVHIDTRGTRARWEGDLL